MELQEGSQRLRRGMARMAIYSPLIRLDSPEGQFTPPYDPVLKLLLTFDARALSVDSKLQMKKKKVLE